MITLILGTNEVNTLSVSFSCSFLVSSSSIVMVTEIQLKLKIGKAIKNNDKATVEWKGKKDTTIVNLLFVSYNTLIIKSHEMLGF